MIAIYVTHLVSTVQTGTVLMTLIRIKISSKCKRRLYYSDQLSESEDREASKEYAVQNAELDTLN